MGDVMRQGTPTAAQRGDINAVLQSNDTSWYGRNISDLVKHVGAGLAPRPSAPSGGWQTGPPTAQVLPWERPGPNLGIAYQHAGLLPSPPVDRRWSIGTTSPFAPGQGENAWPTGPIIAGGPTWITGQPFGERALRRSPGKGKGK